MNEDDQAPRVSYNVAFLVRNYPPEMHIQGPTSFMGRIDEAFIKPLRELAPKHSEIAMFVGANPAEQFTWVGIQLSAETRLNAVAEARHRVEGFVDAAALTIETAVTPTICDIIFVGLTGDPKLMLSRYHGDSWIHMVHGGNEGNEFWKDRSDRLRARLVSFYQLATDGHSKSVSDLGMQLRHSLRLFRHGVQTGCYGVEFICKFCALEGLVCGDIRHDKKRHLVQRLKALLPSEAASVGAKVEELWKYRSEAVHTARAFDSGPLDHGASLGVNLENLNRIFVAVVVFALDQIPNVDTVSDLWVRIGSYSLPPYAFAKRPDGMTQYALKNAEFELKIGSPTLGSLFESTLKTMRARVAQKQGPAIPARGTTHVPQPSSPD